MIHRNRILGAAALLVMGIRSVAQTPAQAPSDVPVMTLDEAVSMALQNNELIAQTTEAARKAHARLREVGANGLPQVRLAYNAQRQKEVIAHLPSKYDESGVPIAFTAITLSPGTSKTANAVATQMLDVWGAVRRARQAASISSRMSELSILRSKSEVVYQTRTAYYNVLRALAGVEATQAAVQDAEEQLRLAEAFVKAGTSAQFDVTRAQVTMADRRQALIAAEDSVSLAGAALNNVLARDVNTPVNIAPASDLPSREVDIAAQTAKALESRPEVIQADLGVRANDQIVAIQKLGNLPSVALSGVYSYNFTAAGFSTDKANWNYGVNVAWPLWDSGSARAKVAEAKADVRTAEMQRQQLHRGVALEVRQSGLRVQETADRFRVAEKAVGLAEEALRLAKVRYQNGVATQLEVTDADTALTAARFNRLNAQYDHLSARAAFDASVMGRMQSGMAAQ